MNRRELRGEVFGYFSNADSLPSTFFDRLIDHGIWSVFRRARNTRHFQQVREKFIPLVDGEDEVDLGADVEAVAGVYRQDKGGARVFMADPRQEQESQRLYDEAPSFEYMPLANGRIRLLQTPDTSSVDAREDGLRLHYRPRPVRLTGDDQEPDLPLATHEAIVVEAVSRGILKEGASIGDPGRFEKFRARVSQELDLYLTPSLEDSQAPAPDNWGFYDQEGWL